MQRKPDFIDMKVSLGLYHLMREDGEIVAHSYFTAGIEGFSFHDLRRTAASWMRMGGADIHTVAQILGYKDLRMAARYQHLSPAFLLDVVKLLDSAFANSQNLLTN